MKDYFRQAGRTVTRTFDFRGRAGRSEFIAYLVLSQLPVMVVALGTAWMESDPLGESLVLGMQALVTVPLFALCARRFHGIARSGWWSAPFLALVIRTLLLDAIGLAAGWSVRSPIEAVLSYVDWLLIVPAVASFVAMAAWPEKGSGDAPSGNAAALS